MRKMFARGVCWVLAVGVVLGGVALADGGAYGAQGQSGQKSGTTQANFMCRGGVRVQVALGSDTARVEFAGRTQTLRLTPDNTGGSYQNARVAWFTKGDTSYMRDKATGRLALSNCKQTQ